MAVFLVTFWGPGSELCWRIWVSAPQVWYSYHLGFKEAGVNKSYLEKTVAHNCGLLVSSIGYLMVYWLVFSTACLKYGLLYGIVAWFFDYLPYEVHGLAFLGHALLARDARLGTGGW